MKKIRKVPFSMCIVSLVLVLFFVGCDGDSDDDSSQNLNQSCNYTAEINGTTYSYCYNAAAGYNLAADCTNSTGLVSNSLCDTEETCLVDQGAGYYPTYISGTLVSEGSCTEALDGTWYTKK